MMNGRKPKPQNGPKSEWPKMVYPGGDTSKKGVLAKNPDGVPKGYAAHPAAFTEKAAPAPKKAKPAPKKSEDADPNKGLAKELGMTRKELIADLTEAQIEFDPKAGVDALAAIYKAALEAQDDDDDESDDDESDDETEDDDESDDDESDDEGDEDDDG